MLIRICAKITQWLIQNGILSQELADWCIYLLQKRILTSFVVLLMFLLGSTFFGIEITACFLLGLLPLRLRLSGFHTKSPYACVVLSLSITLLALLLHSTFNHFVSLVFSIANFLVCLTLVTGVLGNQADLKLHLSKEEIKENHKLAIRVLILESTVSVAVAFLLHSVACLSACQMGIAVVVLSSAYNKLKPNWEVTAHGKNS